MEPGFVVFVPLIAFILLLVGFATLRGLAGIQARLAVINRIEQKLDLVLQHAGLKFDPFSNVPPEVIEALQQRQKIKAIQLYRLKMGTGLKDAKEFIEELQRRSGLT